MTQREGRLRPLGPGPITGFVVAGLVGGWLLRPVAVWLGFSAPLVSWLQVGALAFVAAVLGATAWSTRRTVREHRTTLEAHRAVNRLVLGKACALVGAAVAGGYAGYALSWLGIGAELADERAWRSVAAAVAGVAITVAALLLERACRTGSDDPGA